MSFITPGSFDPNAPLNVNISGQGVTVNISGVTVNAPVSGQPVTVSGNMVSISGQPVSIGSISISGSVVTVSGNVVNVSGNVVNISGNVVRISGQPVSVSISGNVVVAEISGSTITASTLGAFVINSDSWKSCTGGSGGTQLDASPTLRVLYVQNIPTNSGNMHVAGISGDAPHATKGYVLTPGQSVNLSVRDRAAVRVYATVSGERVAVIGETYPL